MRKRLVSVLLALVMALSVTACGDRKIVSTELEDTETVRDEKDDKDTGEKEEKEEKETGTAEDQKEVLPSADGVVLGGDFSEDYDGFPHLSCVTLTADSTAAEDSQTLKIFVPADEYAGVYGNMAYADTSGVSLNATLNPYLQYEAERYTAEENLDAYLADMYDEFYTTSYKAMEVSPAQRIGKGAYATVSYCDYDSWDDAYYPVYRTYYLAELGDSSLLVEVEVSEEWLAGDTDVILAELSAFYEIPLSWDEAAAAKKLEDLMASGEADQNLISTDCLICELPAGWSQDYDYGDYSEYAFAPGGDTDEAGCVITFTYEYMSMDENFDMADQFLSQEDIDDFAEYLQETGGDAVSDIRVERLDETNLGNTVKISYRQKDEDYEDTTYVYAATNGQYLYVIQAVAVQGCDVDVEKVVEDAIATVKVRYS